MKRIHLHIAVNNLVESIDFYSVIFGTKPSIIRDDYAKWLLDEPAVNFAISLAVNYSGIEHVGIQVESDCELKPIATRLDNAEIRYTSQHQISCCYSRSNKLWLKDPAGLSWEVFRTISSDDAPRETLDCQKKNPANCCVG